MMVQNRYQRRRMYTRIALGKNHAMDVVSGESSGGSGQLLILYPLLFSLQLLQCWIGALSTPAMQIHPDAFPQCPHLKLVHTITYLLQFRVTFP